MCSHDTREYQTAKDTALVTSSKLYLPKTTIRYLSLKTLQLTAESVNDWNTDVIAKLYCLLLFGIRDEYYTGHQ